MKKFLLLAPVLLMTGCASQLTRLSPLEQPRNASGQYPVEVQFNSNQESLLWDTIKPYVQVDGQSYPLRPEPMLKNRWEGYVPVPPDANETAFRFKFDYLYNAFGSQPQPGSAWSPKYILKIIGP
ncbi:MAG: hypothetical protein KGR98_07340 [Verrucomicrobia bacterium]|nr:hypothetical protein [Verrucomicrobiota bacterium]MDE3098064.1 hypothetical protein [Verrucomicrobiota bacterium]